MQRGEKREHTYRFQNTGTESIEIAIISSCDCTTLKWAEGKIIHPGEREEIHVVFDSTEKEQSETVDVDVILEQEDDRGRPIIYTVQYQFELL